MWPDAGMSLSNPDLTQRDNWEEPPMFLFVLHSFIHSFLISTEQLAFKLKNCNPAPKQIEICIIKGKVKAPH